MYLISAYFDDVTNKKIQRLIHQVAARTNNTFMTDSHVPPHMTISSIEARSAEVLLPPIRALEGTLARGSVQFVSVGQLLPYVLYITPVLNAYLQSLSEQIYAAVSEIEQTSVSKYYRPLSWLPHVTIAKTLSREQMREAFAVVQDSFGVFEGQITEIGVARTNPHEDILRFPLTQTASPRNL